MSIISELRNTIASEIEKLHQLLDSFHQILHSQLDQAVQEGGSQVQAGKNPFFQAPVSPPPPGYVPEQPVSNSGEESSNSSANSNDDDKAKTSSKK